jgi:hypothetical protein
LWHFPAEAKICLGTSQLPLAKFALRLGTAGSSFPYLWRMFVRPSSERQMLECDPQLGPFWRKVIGHCRLLSLSQ